MKTYKQAIKAIARNYERQAHSNYLDGSNNPEDEMNDPVPTIAEIYGKAVSTVLIDFYIMRIEERAKVK